MNSKQIQNMEPNQQQTIYSYFSSTSNINQALPPNDNSNISKKIQNNKNSKTVTEITEKKYEENTVPFKSLVEEDDENKMDIITEPLFSTANITNNNYLFYNNSYNPFAQNPKDINERNPLNELNHNQQKKNETSMNKFDRSATYNKRIKSHARNTINSLYENMEISKNKVMKIQIYKSQTRPRGRITTFAPNSIKQEDVLELNNNIIKEENENVKEKYITLVKRIATQLKKKIKPPTKGYFHMYIIIGIP